MERRCTYCTNVIPETRHANATTCSKEHSIKLKKKRERENYRQLVKMAGKTLKEIKQVAPILETRPLTIEEMFFNDKTIVRKNKNNRGRPRVHYTEYINELPLYSVKYKETVFDRFGNNIAKYFRSNDLKLDVVSRELGIDRNELRDILKGKYVLDNNIVTKIKSIYPSIDITEISKFINGEISLYIQTNEDVSFGKYVGHMIREYRVKHNCSMLKLSKIVSVDNAYLSKVENGQFDTISFSLLHNLCKVFKCKASDILKF